MATSSPADDRYQQTQIGLSANPAPAPPPIDDRDVALSAWDPLHLLLTIPAGRYQHIDPSLPPAHPFGELLDSENVFSDAIEQRRCVEIKLDGVRRFIEPAVYGYLNGDVRFEAVSARQIWPQPKPGQEWLEFSLDDLEEEPELWSAQYEGVPEGYVRGISNVWPVICEIDQ